MKRIENYTYLASLGLHSWKCTHSFWPLLKTTVLVQLLVLPIMKPVRLKSPLYWILEYCLWRSKWIDFSARFEWISDTQTGVATSRYSFSWNYFWSSIFVVCYLSPQKVWGVELSQIWRNYTVCVWDFSCLRKQVAPPKISKHLKLIPIYLGNQVLIF